MTRTEDSLRETLNAKVLGRTADADLLIRASMHRYRRARARALVATSIIVAVTAITVVTFADFGHDHGKSAAAQSYPLPVTTLVPGSPHDLSSVSGPFTARMTANGACASIAGRDFAFLWPKGFRVTLKPVQLLSPSGQVVAKGGETIHATGGAALNTSNRCARHGQLTFSVSGNIEKGANRSTTK